MEIIIKIAISSIAFLHRCFLYFETFARTTKGQRNFTKYPAYFFKKTKALAANQGLYNRFLAAGLIRTFYISDEVWRTNVSLFFSGCVAVAGIYGAVTAHKKIFFVQLLPALVPILLILK
jgi:putative membrane protein